MFVGVTGAAGFLGRQVCLELERLGIAYYPIDNLYNPASKRPWTLKEDLNVLNMANCDLYECTHLINLAAHSAIEKDGADSLLIKHINITETLRMFTWLNPNTRVIQASSAAVYSQSTYGKSKAFIDVYLNLFFKNSLRVRIQNLYGPEQPSNSNAYGVVQRFLDAEEIIVHNPGNQKRSFVHVNDAAKALCASLKSDVTGVVGLEGENFSILELAKEISLLSGKKITFKDSDPGLSAPIFEPNSLWDKLGIKREHNLKTFLEETFSSGH